MELKELDNNLLKMKKFLEEIKSRMKSSEQALSCIKTFCDKSQLWMWIQEKSKSIVHACCMLL